MVDTTDPDFITYLEAENAAADNWFAPHDATIEAIFSEIKSRVRETDMSTPVKNGPWWYVTRSVEGLSYPIHHRGPTADTATDHVLIDENAEAEGHDYFDLGSFDATMDHRFLAWSTDTDGDERYTLQVKDLETGTPVGEVITDVSNAGTAWSQDGRWLFYVTPDEQERPCRVWRHRMGTSSADDVCIHDEDDERFFVGIGTTRSDRWIVIHAGSRTSAEVRLVPTNAPESTPTMVAERQDDIEYSVDDWGDRFVIVTNTDADDFRVLTAPVDDELRGLTDSATWTELIAHEPGRRITGVEPFRDHLLVHEWAAAQPQLRVLFHDGSERAVEMGAEPHDIDLSANPEWEATTFRLVTQSLSSPLALFEEQVGNGERTLLRRIPTPNVDIESYRSTRLWAPSVDGVEVPIDVVHHVDTPLDGTAPGVLYGYGSYEASLPPWFSVARLSLLDRGHVWALAHPRGGGELGRQWYLDGKLEQKQHTFDDMLACAEHLVTTRVVAHTRLAIRGGSAGGLLVGACMTQRPDLFASVVAEVPFVDIVSTMSDPTLPLTVTEWEEWGDPRREPFASVMEAYSPYDNVRAVDYPAVYVTAGMNDPRVSVHEPAKFVARLRSLGTGSAPVVMRTEMGSGHGGPSGRYEAWRDEARTLAFLLETT